MLQLKITKPNVGKFVWEPPPRLQASILGLPVERQESVKEQYCDFVEKYLLLIMMMIYSHDSYSAEANEAALIAALDDFARQSLARLEAERNSR
jgi:hypothetical protein